MADEKKPKKNTSPKEVKEKTSEKVEKTEKPEKAKILTQSEKFNWKNGNNLEKAAFIGSIVFLLGAVVCLIFEFTMATESWPFIWFDIFIGLSFLGETFTHRRFDRRIAIVTGVAGGLFLILGILKLVGVIVA